MELLCWLLWCLSNVKGFIQCSGQKYWEKTFSIPFFSPAKSGRFPGGQVNDEPLQSINTVGTSVPSAKHFLAKANSESFLVISRFDLAVVPHHEAGNVLAGYWHLSSLANLLNLTSVLICCFVVFSLSTHLAPPCTPFKGLKDAAHSKRLDWP